MDGLMEDRSKNNKIETKTKAKDQKRKLARKYFMRTLFWNRRSPFHPTLMAAKLAAVPVQQQLQLR